MTSPIFNMMSNNIDPLYTQGRIRHRVEDQLPKLTAGARVHTLKDHERHRYEYDLYNLLSVLRIPPSAYYATMRINGWTHPEQFSVDTVELLIPDLDDLRWLHDVHQLYQRY